MSRKLFIPGMLVGLFALLLRYQLDLVHEQMTASDYDVVVGLVGAGLGLAALGRR